MNSFEDDKSVLAKHFNITPGGKWTLEDGKKVSIDAHRYQNSSWDKFPNDNMGKHFLRPPYVIVDIDGEPWEWVDDTRTAIRLLKLDITMPVGLFTHTSTRDKLHLYYQAEHMPTRVMIKGIFGFKIDILQNFNVFDPHGYSINCEVVDGEIPPLPDIMVELIESYVEEKNIADSPSEGPIQIYSNPVVANFVKLLLLDGVQTVKQKNAMIRAIVPKEFIPPRSKALKWKKFEFNYDFINKIAVKLSAIKELDFYEHVTPALYKIVEECGRSPLSKQAKAAWARILPSLPKHEAMDVFDTLNDIRSIQELITEQNTPEPIFFTSVRGDVRYIKLDSGTMAPIYFSDDIFLKRVMAEQVSPERRIVDESGRSYWDDVGIPYVDVVDNPYKPGYYWEEDKFRHTINLSQPSKFIAQAQPLTTVPEGNLLYKTVKSVVHPDYLDIVLNFHAQAIFGETSPIMVLWVATPSSVKGGTGKSMVTVTILSKIMQARLARIDLKLMASSYDMTSGVKTLSLEDTEAFSKSVWIPAYEKIKQLQSASYSKLNPKYGVTKTHKVKVSITGSSNDRLMLSPSDRRILCLEPAHVDGITKPLTPAEASMLAEFELHDGPNFDDLIQEYTDYLYHLYNTPLEDRVKEALYREAPETPYRFRWVVSGVNNTQSITLTLPNCKEFMSIVHESRFNHNLNIGFDELIEYLLMMWNEEHQKIALSYRWFEFVIPIVAADADIQMTKKSISSMLGIDLKHGSNWAVLAQKTTKFYSWPQDMYTFSIQDSQVEAYRDWLNKYRNNIPPEEDMDI